MANDAVDYPLVTLLRHRMGVDGAGVTTLAASFGCPLRCRMCLNPQCWREGTRYTRVTARQLYDMARVDDLYFQATGGGVTFGGGESLLHADFIRRFRALCGGAWRLTAETSLNVPPERVRTALECVDEFIVDIKDTDPDIYRRYTGADNARALDNLAAVLAAAGPERVLVRVPLIPGYNTEADAERSAGRLRAMGATRLDRFTYRVMPEWPARE